MLDGDLICVWVVLLSVGEWDELLVGLIVLSIGDVMRSMMMMSGRVFIVVRVYGGSIKMIFLLLLMMVMMGVFVDGV